MASPAKRAQLFGVWLKKQRADKGLSHEYIAREMRKLLRAAGYKIPASQIVKFEQGKIPDGPQLYALSRAIKIPFADVNARLCEAIGVPLATSTVGDITRPPVIQSPEGSLHGRAVLAEMLAELIAFLDANSQRTAAASIRLKDVLERLAKADRQAAGPRVDRPSRREGAS